VRSQEDMPELARPTRPVHLVSVEAHHDFQRLRTGDHNLGFLSALALVVNAT
jgi:hypothetical protein